MNTLLINLDSELAQENNKFTTGAYLRHIEYAKLLSNYFIIARTPRFDKFKIRNPVKNLHIFPTQSLNKISFIYDAFRMSSQICKKNKIDIISCQDPFSTGLVGYLLKKKFNTPLNIHILGDVIDNPYFLAERRLNHLLNKLAKIVLKNADTIRVSTAKQKEKLTGLGIENKKIWHIPFFINSDLFLQTKGENIRRRYLGDKFNRLVLYVGRLAKEKRIETLICAIPLIIKEYPRVLFLIVGQGPEERKIRNIVLNLRIEDNVCFTGSICYDRIPDFFSACDLFVITSVYEGTCMALLEAAVCKKPIISTTHSGAEDAIRDGYTGFMVDFDDHISLSKKILYLLNNSQIAEEMGERGQGFILERFDKRKILQDYFRMWEATSKIA